MQLGFGLAAFALTALVCAKESSAEDCTSRDHMAQQLGERFGETLYSVAPGASDAVIEVFASEGASSWSVTVFLPDSGLSCLAASGKGKQALQTALTAN